MITVSDEWKKIHQRPLLPESFVEITLGLEDKSRQYLKSIGWWQKASFSQTAEILHNQNIASAKYYATLEENLWSLDGSRQILPEADPNDNPGWVSQDNTTSTENGVQVNFYQFYAPESPLGLSITWSSEYNEYPVNFRVEVWNGDELVGTKDVNGNNSVKSHVDYDFGDYTKLCILPLDWNIPNHRFRIDQLFFGRLIIFDKNQILSYDHEQTGDPLSGEIPKNTITFSLDNYDGNWDLLNPDGDVKYLAEQQKITVRYGQQTDWDVEWIPGGQFYLSEWRNTDNNTTFTIVAKDVFEYWGANYQYNQNTNSDYGYLVKPETTTGTFWDDRVVAFKTLDALYRARATGVVPSTDDEAVIYGDGLTFGVSIPFGGRGEYIPETVINGLESIFVYRSPVYNGSDFVYYVDGDCVEMPSDKGFASVYPESGETVSHYLSSISSSWVCREMCDDRSMPINRGNRSRAEIIQLASNMCGYMTHQSAVGSRYTGPYWKSVTDYVIRKDLSYHNPEIELAKPLKQVRVYYSHDLLIDPYLYEHNVSDDGEVITVDNPYVNQSAWAKYLAEQYAEFYKERTWISGEFRADPRLELFDIVQVEGRNGRIGWVLITQIKYSYNGSFYGTYKGKLLTDEFIAKVR